MKETSLSFNIKETLCVRGAVSDEGDVMVEGNLLVATEPALVYSDRHQRAGHDRVEIFPAFYNGKQSWMMRRNWSPGDGYSASGTHEYILDFKEGVEIFLQRGVFELAPPSEPLSKSA